MGLLSSMGVGNRNSRRSGVAGSKWERRKTGWLIEEEPNTSLSEQG